MILHPVSQTGYEKVAKIHFLDFDFDFLAKEKVRELILIFVTEVLAYMITLQKLKFTVHGKRIIIIIIIVTSLFKEDYVLSTYILIYHMVLLKLNNKTYKHLDTIYTLDINILYIYVL